MQSPSTTPSPLVLVVEDERAMRKLLVSMLETHAYRTLDVEDGASALTHASMRNPDMVLLDLGLPDIDGITVTARLREWCTAPILVLSARGQEADKIAALDAGANDYLTKPFGAGELFARMRVWLRQSARGDETSPAVLDAGDLRVDLARRLVSVAEREIHLTPTEYKLLALLMKHAGRVLTHDQILRDIWGPRCTGQTHYLRVYMAQLRQKLEREPARPRYLLTEAGVGYRLAAA